MAVTKIWKPTREQIQAAHGKRVADLIAPNLKVLFCGINPGLYTAAVGHHFSRPGNRFWPTLHRAGFTDRQLSPFDAKEFLALGYGITNLGSRATAAAAELADEELIRGAKKLAKKVEKFKPAVVAIVGISAYRIAFDRPKATIGLQKEKIAGRDLWVLPNPSGLNAHFVPVEMQKLFRKLKLHVDRI